MITMTENQATMCRFCKNNGEDEKKYSSHTLKDSSGRVLCPVLRAFRCVRCGATGDRAHTIKYCPMKENGIDRALLLRLGRCVSSLDAFMYNDDNDGSRGSFGAPSNPPAPQSPSSSTFNESLFSSS